MIDEGREDGVSGSPFLAASAAVLEVVDEGLPLLRREELQWRFVVHDRGVLKERNPRNWAWSWKWREIWARESNLGFFVISELILEEFFLFLFSFFP